MTRKKKKKKEERVYGLFDLGRGNSVSRSRYFS